MKKSFPKITFLALKSYSLVGGLQQFNRRIVSALSDLAKKYESVKPTVVLRGDSPEHVKNQSEMVDFIACGHSSSAFLRASLKKVSNTDLLLLGHVNLLPVAFLAKMINPRIKIVLFVHGVDVWGVNARKMKKLDPFLIKFIDQIASVSNFTAEKMSKVFNLPFDKFTIFPNAVDPLSSCLQNNNDKKPMLLTVARLSENEWGKHHDSILKALPQILKKIPNVKYRIVGEGVLRTHLEELANLLDVAHAVEFTGRLSDHDLARSYAEASVFVMPSEKEGFGIVFLEAWLRSIPVICGTEDASHEVVSDSIDGFAIHHNDIDLIAEKIIFLLSNPIIAAEMGAKGNQKVMENYLMSNFVGNLEKILTGDK